ncbi:MAG: Eco57I restriction-modification methylase domain-containing protein [Anaerolineae bacterium]|nr:Eco57I restriction-modification methylase domain-containing protein [Anaerolineae bacterium]
MAFYLAVIRRYIQAFDFQTLFNYLGWDNHQGQLVIPLDGQQIALSAVAEKRGMVVYRCNTLLDYSRRTKVERQVAKSTFEHLIVYTDGQREQIWQWVRREVGKPLANRERRFYRGQTGENIAQALTKIAFSFDEEEALTLVDVTSRMRATFDLEPVTRRFYDRFQRQHDAFLAFIEGIPDEDLQQWYASVMLNRLMFIYFVQKKGFLDGDVDYLRNHLEQVEGNFYRDFLCPLFFDGFASKEHPQEIRRLLGDVPYLNGGLFMRHQIEELYGEAIQIENIAFEKLFDFFDDYRWHLDERPLRNDNEINPDVLGYIFEKYINQKQMGAYYTKEDITDYISKNTVIPFLFDEASKAVKIAFEGEHTLWDLLTENPDRYIYPAVQRGVEYDLPENIAIGLDDVSQRGAWNTPAPSDYALPAEIWREVVDRRKRYAEISDKLARSEVRHINDLITLNLDIRQFAQDVIDYTDSADVVRAFWKAINRVTVLDPTCGSGAFLFAALNILEPLYEACLERMEGFVAELERSGGYPQSYNDFREVLARIDQHPNRRYFILKSIIVNNLFGVDIMEEAVEICKLRLFLKLVAQVDDKSKIEPLPDIDFNIRAGNTLVGFATRDQIQGNLFAQAVLPQIEVLTGTLNTFRKEQLAGNVSPETMTELKSHIQQKINEIVDVLDKALAPIHGFGTDQVARFRDTHKPFHWFAEFYGVLNSGGFDVIIGNPPYATLNSVKEYSVIGYKTTTTRNLYPLVLERCLPLAVTEGRSGYIVPVSSISTDGYSTLQEIVFQYCLHASSFDDRPARLFEGLEHIQLTIWLIQNRPNTEGKYHTTECFRWSSVEREHLFSRLEYQEVETTRIENTLPKISSHYEQSLLERVFSDQAIIGHQMVKRGKYSVYYSRKVHNFLQALDFVPEVYDGDDKLRAPSELKELRFSEAFQSDVIFCLLNSTLFRWFINVFSDCRHVNKREVEGFPINLQKASSEEGWQHLAEVLSDNLKSTSEFRTMRFSHDTLRIQCIIPKLSKPIIDDIDYLLARHYGFTDEELDFIINYDIKYRLGDDLDGDEGDGE